MTPAAAARQPDDRPARRAGRRPDRACARRDRRHHRVRRDLDPQHADPRRHRATGPHPLRARAQRGRRDQHGGRLCAGEAIARRRDDLDRDGGRQRRGLAGRGAHRRLAGPAHHLADRPAVHGPRPRRDPRRAAPGRHAAGDLEGLFPRVGRAHRRRHDRGGGTGRADRAARAGVARNPDRRAARKGPAPAPHRHRANCAAQRRSKCTRHAGGHGAARQAPDAVARRRRARGGDAGARSRRARLCGGHQHQRPRGRARGAPPHARRLQHDGRGAGDLRPRRSHDRGRLAAARQRDPQQHDALSAPAHPDRRRCRPGRAQPCGRSLHQCRCRRGALWLGRAAAAAPRCRCEISG